MLYFGPVIILQILCAVHVVRTGRQFFWIWIIIMAPGIGCAIYFFAEVLPDLGNNPLLRRTARQATRTLDPAREKRRIEQRLAVADTPKNRLDLANECLNLGDFENASQLYKSCLTGIYASDPQILLGFATARFGCDDFATARTTLEDLTRTNPDFKSPDAQLLYARTLDALGQQAEALAEYEMLVKVFAGEEARARYAVLLKKLGRDDEARNVLEEMLRRTRAAPGYYRKREAGWLKLAQKELA